MPRPKVNKDNIIGTPAEGKKDSVVCTPGDEVNEGKTLQSAMRNFFVGCEFPKKIDLLDATMPYDNAMTNNQVRAAIRETRAKLNEIINILNVR